MGLVKLLHLTEHGNYSFSRVILTKDVKESTTNDEQSTGKLVALSAM